MENSFQFQSALAETLLVPLYMRALESRRGKNAILQDPFAEDLVSRIPYDYTQIGKDRLTSLGCVIRSWYFDRAVLKFIQEHENPVVVNVGCGLDTRSHRLKTSREAVYYEVDLPEVIALRNSLIPETSNIHNLSASLTDSRWLKQLHLQHPQSSFIFVAEGVMMFFYEREIQGFLHALADNFPGGEIWFDVIGEAMFRKKMKPRSLDKIDVQIRSGLSDAATVEQWDLRLIKIDQAHYPGFFRDRWGFFIGHILGRMKNKCFSFSSAMGFRIHSNK